MAWIRNAWNNFKAQPEIWFFYGFILTSPLSIRKVFLDYPLMGEFNEYSGIYLYLSDVFLGLTVGSWLISILYNTLSTLSIFTPHTASTQEECSTPVGMFHGEHPMGQAWNFLWSRRETKVIILGLPVFLVIWSFITINWSGQPQIAFYRSFKLFEFYLLYLFLALNPKCSTPVGMFHGEHPTRQAWNILRNVFRIIIAVGLINAIIGILQVVIQHSLGLFWLKESLISPDLPGVAKIILGGAKYIRAYGLFPHPNILGGFLLLSIILTLAYWDLFHACLSGRQVKQSRPAGAARCASWDNNQSKIYSAQDSFSANHNCSTWNNYERYNCYIFAFILALQIVAGILTFSKSAILGLILALAYIYRHQIVKMFHVKHFNLLRAKIIKNAALMAIIFGLGIYLIRPDFGSIFIKSLAERLVYINISLNVISGNFLAGIGAGQFVLEMQRYLPETLLAWHFQPVHNVFLLIWSELGLIGLSLFGWFIWELFHPSRNVPRGTFYGAGVKQEQVAMGSKNVPCGIFGSESSVQTVFKAFIIGFFAIALFDHYLWDIQQGQIMLWMILGFLANSNLRSNLT